MAPNPMAHQRSLSFCGVGDLVAGGLPILSLLLRALGHHKDQ
jgi:hypothetical protein